RHVATRPAQLGFHRSQVDGEGVVQHAPRDRLGDPEGGDENPAVVQTTPHALGFVTKPTRKPRASRCAECRSVAVLASALTYDCLAVTNSGRLVLVVEDDDSIRNLLTDVLKERGFRVLAAVDGADALGRLTSIRPDVMVLDLLMPVMHGWDFMET